MSYTIAVVSDEPPGASELDAALAAATAANARWLVRLRDTGRELPCCVGCTGLQYVPDTDAPSVRVVFRTGAALLSSGHGSCGELAALQAAIHQVEAGSPSAARAVVRRVPSSSHAAWHAIVELSSGELVDVTKELDHG